MKKLKSEPVKPTTQREHIAAMVPGTLPEDWCLVTRGTALYKQGYRWYNRVTKQRARKLEPQT